MNLSINRTGRSRILVIWLLIIGAIFVVRLFWLQVVKHDHYVAKAKETQITQFTIPAKRGLIYAKDGNAIVPLVMNEPVYTVYADPSQVKDVDKVESLVRRVAGGEIREGFEEDLQNKESRYAILAKQVTKKQAEEIKKADLSGVGLQEFTRRVYPEGKLAGQLLGYVNTDSIGQYGLEGALNERLSGKPGQLKALTDVRQIPLSISDEYVRLQAQDGENLVLNVDRNIQTYAEQALKNGLERAKAKHGSVIVMNPANGAVMAMANYPTYEPGRYFEVGDVDLFNNKVVSEPYEAGSVIKTLTMGAGLDSGVVNRNSTYQNHGSVRVADFTIKNATTDSIGTTNMTDVLHYSLNTGVVHVLKQMGGGEINGKAKDTLYRYFTDNYRFDKETGIEQAGEVPGQLIAPTSGEGGPVRYANMTFGQGMNVTMVQVSSAFSAAINGGTFYKPQLVDGARLPNGEIKDYVPEVIRDNVLSADASKNLREMVVEARQAGFISRNDKEGYNIGGKTGTSQIIDPKTGKYSDDNSIGTYLGFGGGETPEYVIMVRVQDSKLPGYAGTEAAAPIFGDLSNWLLEYLQVQPIR